MWHSKFYSESFLASWLPFKVSHYIYFKLRIKVCPWGPCQWCLLLKVVSNHYSVNKHRTYSKYVSFKTRAMSVSLEPWYSTHYQSISVQARWRNKHSGKRKVVCHKTRIHCVFYNLSLCELTWLDLWVTSWWPVPLIVLIYLQPQQILYF